MTTFYKNYIALCAQKKKSASAVAEEIGLSRTSPNGWKKGKMPSDINLQKLSSYFGVSVEKLIEEQKEKSSTPEGVELTKTQQQAWDLIQSMDDDSLRKFIAIAKAVMGV